MVLYMCQFMDGNFMAIILYMSTSIDLCNTLHQLQKEGFFGEEWEIHLSVLSVDIRRGIYNTVRHYVMLGN